MNNEGIGVQVPLKVYLELAFRLRTAGDTRGPDEVVAFILKSWLGSEPGVTNAGYQWKELFLPDGTELRMRYRGVYYYARIDSDKISYAGETVTPRGWALMVTGTVRNPWRDIWLRRGIHECWTRASMWRANAVWSPSLPQTDRRRYTRRIAD